MPAGLANVARVFMNSYCGVALKNDHSLVSWGTQYCGQVKLAASPAASKTDVVQVYSTKDTHCALSSGGGVSCWGGEYWSPTEMQGLQNVDRMVGTGIYEPDSSKPHTYPQEAAFLIATPTPTAQPTSTPTSGSPTSTPTSGPSGQPTKQPITATPTAAPTVQPSAQPTYAPSVMPTRSPCPAGRCV